MLRAKTRWQLAACDETRASELARECNIPPLLAKLLIIRGIDTAERIHAFLNVSIDQFHDPFRLDGMDVSVERIRRAISAGEPICLYGDYDADGVSATTLMIHVLRQLGAVFDYYIPNRFTEGYGLHTDALKTIYDRGFKLVVTVDTGISAARQVAYGQELGLDIIVTDHHEPPAVIPDALAVMNPKKPGCSYPFDMLAGVGVAFKLAHALLGQPPMHLADIAAIGTIADLVPLVDENRLLASFGLRALNQTRHPGLKALIRVCGLEEKELTAGHVGFGLAPRINAGGRLETAEAAVRLLASDDAKEAAELAQTLDDLNRERQELVQTMTEEAEEMVRNHFPADQNSVLVLAKTGWNVGVVGIVASRLVETFYRPTIVLGIDPDTGMAKGSARSIAGFDLYEALTACQELLPHFGGHTMAAGMTLPVENIEQLREKMNQIARERLSADDFIPQTRVDAEIQLDAIDLETVSSLQRLAPFGMGNPTPLIQLADVYASSMRKIGRDDSHLKCMFAADGEGRSLDAIGFQLAPLMEHLTPGARIQVVGELSLNEWNNQRKPQLIIRDLAVPHKQVFDWRGSREKQQKWLTLLQGANVATAVFQPENYQQLQQYLAQSEMASCLLMDGAEMPAEAAKADTLVLYDLPTQRAALEEVLSGMKQTKRLYCLFGDPEFSFEQLHFPSRDQFKGLYQIFHQYRQVKKQHLDSLARKQRWTRATLDGMLAVFVELGFIREEGEQFSLHPEPQKTALDNSPLYRRWQEQTELYTELLLSSQEELTRYLNQWWPETTA
ncbi:single-stranded-DNA-specific exonuclease RecJ [Brevibacillus sp. B_LB10_24]|uniref:single-stranded-DNA-specific exonuclease RecJ n=1 Tax=Brevibacillus sp. B_LB10_24 TaxID=3380645 RepID=UPI0038B748C4